MFRTIWQYLRNDYARRRFGLDNADVQHIRADLRFRLALVEYAYFGRSGKKVASSLAELRSLLGDKAIHRYLRSLDPDLRTQFVERFQSRRRDAELSAQMKPRATSAGAGSAAAGASSGAASASAPDEGASPAPFGANVVSLNMVRRTGEHKTDAHGSGRPSPTFADPHSVDSSE